MCGLTWNRGGVGNYTVCGYNHFAGYAARTTASGAHSGVLCANRAMNFGSVCRQVGGGAVIGDGGRKLGRF